MQQIRMFAVPFSLALLMGCASVGADTASPQAEQAAGQADMEAMRFVPDGMTPQLTRRGDFDGDGDEDVLVVLERRDVRDPHQPRGLIVLRRGPDGTLAKAADNRRAIPCVACGGMMGDPLVSVDARERGFTLRFEGGSRELWSKEFGFAFDADRSTWVLVEAVRTVADRLDGSSKKDRLAPDEFGSITLDQFDPAEMPDEFTP